MNNFEQTWKDKNARLQLRNVLDLSEISTYKRIKTYEERLGVALFIVLGITALFLILKYHA